MASDDFGDPLNRQTVCEWRPIGEFDPKVHDGHYLFADDCNNVVLGHWHEGEIEPRMAYTGQGGDGDFPIWPTLFTPLPEPFEKLP